MNIFFIFSSLSSLLIQKKIIFLHLEMLFIVLWLLLWVVVLMTLLL